MLQDGFQALLLPILIVVIIGIVTIAGWLTWFLTRRRGRNTPADGMPLASDTLSQPADREPHAPSSPYTLGVKRDASGQWEVHVQGQRYFRLAAVPDAKVRNNAKDALQALMSFAGDGAGEMLPSSGKVAPVPATTQRPGAGSPPSSPLSQRLNQVAQVPVIENEISTTGATRRITPLHGSVPTIDFAYEINQILAEFAEEIPWLREHAVVLQNVPGGGINFFVDGTVYEDKSAIPNAEIQEVIAQATREWERR